MTALSSWAQCTGARAMIGGKAETLILTSLLRRFSWLLTSQSKISYELEMAECKLDHSVAPPEVLACLDSPSPLRVFVQEVAHKVEATPLSMHDVLSVEGAMEDFLARGIIILEIYLAAVGVLKRPRSPTICPFVVQP